MRLNLMVIGFGAMLGYVAWQTPAFAGPDAGAGDATVGVAPQGDVFADGVVIGGVCAGDVYVTGSTGYAFCDDGVWAYTGEQPPAGYTALPDSDGGESDPSDGGGGPDATATDGGRDLDAASLDSGPVQDAMIVGREPPDSGETADTGVNVDAGEAVTDGGPGSKVTPSSSAGCSIEGSEPTGLASGLGAGLVCAATILMTRRRRRSGEG